MEMRSTILNWCFNEHWQIVDSHLNLGFSSQAKIYTTDHNLQQETGVHLSN